MTDTSPLASPLAAWLNTYQGIDASEELADPSRASAGLGHLVQDNLDKLVFDTEPSSFSKMLHHLAPEGLGDE
ncbi:MAG: hypothetical protein HOH04_05025 [Rhodospirillaceae bacterium]|nr:hypothetical protein [Rhodospirillaceae bacterium]